MSIQEVYRTSLALHTDLYQLSMAYGYWKEGLDQRRAVYHLYFRKNPFEGGLTVASGLKRVIDYLQTLRFDDSDIDYLRILTDACGDPLFDEEFYEYLKAFRFQGDLEAVPEGTIVFPHEPLLRVTGSLLECQLLESPLLNFVNFSTLVATKAARISLATAGDEVLEFGLRRAQGVDGALTASRSAYVGGVHATSNVLAGKIYGIPVKGTHAHSWVMAFDDEIESFYAFAKAMPGNSIFLVDTYNTLEGVKAAIEVGKWLKKEGKPFLGIRLDSGDLAYLSIVARQMLDKEGFEEAKIVASNELDERLIESLKSQGAKIAVWGVGTKLATAKDQPALDGVYKLSAITDEKGEWDYRIKLSEQILKISNPGILQVRRFFDEFGAIADVIYDEEKPLGKSAHIVDPFDPTKERWINTEQESVDLLEPIFRKGALVYQVPSIHESRERTLENLNFFHSGVKRFVNPHKYVVGMEKGLYDKKVELIRKIRQQTT